MTEQEHTQDKAALLRERRAQLQAAKLLEQRQREARARELAAALELEHEREVYQQEYEEKQRENESLIRQWQIDPFLYAEYFGKW